ncbi:DUF4190 domain-containing protein [Leifsonia sp. 2TAF2]|uniref:DUF4190 domain-containing protein n=1 Tax=Leifsonia sp. 2TAF2 TaxID=3233009 RepID=UPI003F9DB135
MTFENDPTQQQHTGAPTTYADDAATPAPPAPPANTTNVLAIVAFVAAFFVGLAGVICGIISLTQLKRTGQKGRGFAIAGVVIGGVQIVISVIATIAVIAAGALLGTTGSAALALGQFPQNLDGGKSFQCAQVGNDFQAAVLSIQGVSSTFASDPEAAVDDVSVVVAQFERSAAEVTDSKVAVAADGVSDELNDMLAYLKVIQANSTADGPDVQYTYLLHVEAILEAFDGFQKACSSGK